MNRNVNRTCCKNAWSWKKRYPHSQSSHTSHTPLHKVKKYAFQINTFKLKLCGQVPDITYFFITECLPFNFNSIPYFVPIFSLLPGRRSSSTKPLEASGFAGATSLYSACNDKSHVFEYFIYYFLCYFSSYTCLKNNFNITLPVFQTYCTFSVFTSALLLDSRQATSTPHSIAVSTVWTDKNCRNSSWLQFGCSCRMFGLKVLPAKMLTAQVRVWGGDPVIAGTLHLLLPFAKFQRVLREFK